MCEVNKNNITLYVHTFLFDLTIYKKDSCGSIYTRAIVIINRKIFSFIQDHYRLLDKYKNIVNSFLY